MLILEQYGAKLVRLTQENLELVRNWRNQSDITHYMEYRNYITPEAQIKWFHSVNNQYNYYFIIEFEGKKVGLINAKNFVPEKGFGEGGIFIGEKEYINSFAAVFSTLCLLNFVFTVLTSCNASHIRILKNNDRAIHYNKLLGYTLLPGQEQVENQLYFLSREQYLETGIKLNKAAAVLNEHESQLRYSGTVCAENSEEINKLLIGK